MLDVLRDEVGEEQRVDAFVLVFGLDGHQQQVHTVVLPLQPPEQMEPPGGEHPAARLLERAAHGLH